MIGIGVRDKFVTSRSSEWRGGLRLDDQYAVENPTASVARYLPGGSGSLEADKSVHLI